MKNKSTKVFLVIFGLILFGAIAFGLSNISTENSQGSIHRLRSKGRVTPRHITANRRKRRAPRVSVNNTTNLNSALPYRNIVRRANTTTVGTTSNSTTSTPELSVERYGGSNAVSNVNLTYQSCQISNFVDMGVWKFNSNTDMDITGVKLWNDYFPTRMNRIWVKLGTTPGGNDLGSNGIMASDYVYNLNMLHQNSIVNGEQFNQAGGLNGSSYLNPDYIYLGFLYPNNHIKISANQDVYLSVSGQYKWADTLPAFANTRPLYTWQTAPYDTGLVGEFTSTIAGNMPIQSITTPSHSKATVGDPNLRITIGYSQAENNTSGNQVCNVSGA